MMRESPGRIVFRVDASVEIGSGHVMRCLTLARSLNLGQARVLFLCRCNHGNLIDVIRRHGFEVLCLSDIPAQADGPSGRAEGADDHWRTDADECLDLLSSYGQANWLIVDHYSLDARWETAMRSAARHLMVIDDLANRPHECDLFLDQTYREDGSRYRELLPPHAQKLFGTSYALLKPEFAATRAGMFENKREVEPKTVHVFFGGTDAHANTLRFTTLLLENFPHLSVRVAVGATFPFEQELSNLSATYKLRLSWQKGVTNMAEHMSPCDVAIGAPGMTTWERACLGIPSAYIAIADNQVPILERLVALGFCAFIGTDQEVTDCDFVRAIQSFVGKREMLRAMRELQLAAVDGLGAQRVARTILETGPS